MFIYGKFTKETPPILLTFPVDLHWHRKTGFSEILEGYENLPKPFPLKGFLVFQLIASTLMITKCFGSQNAFILSKKVIFFFPLQNLFVCPSDAFPQIIAGIYVDNFTVYYNKSDIFLMTIFCFSYLIKISYQFQCPAFIAPHTYSYCIAVFFSIAINICWMTLQATPSSKRNTPFKNQTKLFFILWLICRSICLPAYRTWKNTN